MREHTAQQLNALNRAFYAAVAGEFARTREKPWAGFGKIASLFEPEHHEPAPTTTRASPARTILDVGAGDGRFAAFLHARGLPLEGYVGVDASHALLALARERALPGARFAYTDFVAEPADDVLPRGSFELVTVFGVLHHVPSLERRSRLLSALASRLAPGGLLALTFWLLHEDPRFARRRASFAEHNAKANDLIDEHDLEAGDVLLRWGHGATPLRYCHFADDAEIAHLIDATGLPVHARFRGDGHNDALNEYVVLRSPAALRPAAR